MPSSGRTGRSEQLLAEYMAPPLEPGIDAALQEYIARRKMGSDLSFEDATKASTVYRESRKATILPRSRTAGAGRKTSFRGLGGAERHPNPMNSLFFPGRS